MKECPVCRRCFPDHVNHCPDDGDATTTSIAGEPVLDGRYQLERRLGHGGMGVVFQARHIFLKTAHAIKVILPDLVGNDPMLVTRFRQEALAAAAIRHQNIIAVTDFGVVRSTMPFLVMEFVSGQSLHDVLAEEGALPPARALEIISAIGAGVSAAHRQGIVHRDLKPLNIMFQEGLPVAEGLKVLDFGLAKIKSGELLGSFVQAKTSGLMGSPFYMAPEQWGDEEPDARADIYSLGVILFQMLGGDVPFKGTSIPSIMKKHLTSAPPTFASLGIQVPPQIEAVVRHSLEKEAENRPATVEDFIGELRDAVNSLSASLKSTSLGTISAQSKTIAPRGGTSIPPDATTLRIRTNPPNSRVYINNVSVGLSDDAGLLVVADMLRGAHRVHIMHDGYAEWERQVECNGGVCDVEAQLQSLNETSIPPASVLGHQSLGDPYAGTISSGSLAGVPHQSQAAMEAQRLRQQAEALEEQARQEEEDMRREQERREQEERMRLAREQRAREEEEARQKAEEEAALLRAEEEARERAAAEERRKAEEEAARQRAEEEARLRAKQEEEERQAAEAARLKAEEEARKRAEEEARLRAEEEARRKAEEERLRLEAESQRQAEEEAARLRAEEQARLKAEEEARLAAAAKAEEERRQAEEAAARRKAEEEAALLRAQEEARLRAEKEAAQKRAEEERLAREERERAEAEEREREAERQREREEQAARIAATINPQQLPPAELDSTQGQRLGVITQRLDSDSLPGTEQRGAAWQGQPSSGQNRAGQTPFSDSMHGVAEGRKKSGVSPMLIAAIVGVLVIGGGVGVWYMMGTRSGEISGPPVSPPTPTATTTTSTPTQTPSPPVVFKPELISIPGGRFQMGRDAEAGGTVPQVPMHLVTVEPFEIDKTEVTNAEYAEFVRETKHQPPSNWANNQPVAGTEMLPVVNVSYEDAVEFAKWRSKQDGKTYRLPTEEEWEYAARGGDQGNLYPWGNNWVEGHAGVMDPRTIVPKPVGSYPNDKTRWGVLDMEGNVYEWTSSKASYYPGNPQQVRPENRNWIVIRGASFSTDSELKLPLTFRNWYDPKFKNSMVGFRLVRVGASSEQSNLSSPISSVNRLLNRPD